MKVKRLLVFAVIVLIASGSALASAKPESTATSTGPLKFTYLCPVYGPATWSPDSAFAKALFKYANVEIDIHGIPFSDYAAQYPTIIAGGNMPDLFWHLGPNAAVSGDIIAQGGAAALDDLLADYPNLKNAYPSEYWDLSRSPDGHIYSIPAGNVVVPYVPFGIRYRVDLYKKYNVPIPTTLDELVASLKKIVAADPDVDIGITADYYDPWAFQNFGPAFGYGFGNWIPAPGEDTQHPAKIIPSNVSSQYKEFLRFFNMLRKEGLMDPDFMLVKGPGGDDKFKKGQVVAVVGGWWAYLDELKYIKAHNPDWELGMMGSLKGPVAYMGTTTLTPVLNFLSISSKADVRGILSYLDWAFSDKGYAFLQRGVWGKDFQIWDDGGKIVNTEYKYYNLIASAPDKLPEGYGVMDVKVWQFARRASDIYVSFRSDFINTFQTLKDNNKQGYTDDQLKQQAYDLVHQIQDMYEQAAKYTLPNYRRGVYSETETKIGGQLDQQYLVPMRDTILIDPNADVDKLFDDAVKNWYASGGDKIVAEVNAALPDKSRPKDPPLIIQNATWTAQDYINVPDEEVNPQKYFKYVAVPEGDNPIPDDSQYYEPYKTVE